jgi:acetyl esterase
MPFARPETLGWRDRFEGGLARTLLALPGAVQTLLAGGRRVHVDGQALAPELQLALRLMSLAGRPSFETLPVPAARAEAARAAAVFAGPPLPMDRVEDFVVTGPAGDLPVRYYVPPGSEAGGPLLVYFHGGGWVLCGLDTHDEPCRFLAREARTRVLSVDYRLAPEHRFPAAADDALAAFRWAAAHAADLDVAAARIAVAGDSAGGNLAIVTCLLAARDGGPRPAFQMPIYPVTDLSTKHPSYRLFADGFFLTEAQMDWYRGHYLGDAAASDPRASPLLAELLAEDRSGLPPAYVVTAGFDPLRDEGEAYARTLRDAGVPVTLRRHEGLVHGFVNMLSLAPVARAAMHETATALRLGLRAH